MIKTILSAIISIGLLIFAQALEAQESIDGTLNFQSDPAKKYSIYIPSSYDESAPNAMMLALHPLNTNRWDGEAWRDTLIDFAEANNLLVISPDGGSNGAIDDAIDTAFTTVMLDSMISWYNVDESNIYAIGFSWGGKTVYTYGLNHIDRFAGLMPIGAAINGTSEINGVASNAKDKNIYIIHGTNDSPNSRYYPLLDLMETEEACVNTNLLSGVGHTIDFPNRDAILTDAYQWLRDNACVLSSTDDLDQDILQFKIFPNPAKTNEQINL